MDPNAQPQAGTPAQSDPFGGFGVQDGPFQPQQMTAPEVVPGPETFFLEDEQESADPGQGGKETLTPEAVSARHFQALYDRTVSEANRLAEQNRLLMEQLRMTTTPPSNGQGQVNPTLAAGESDPSLQRPQRPQKPQHYDPLDAFNDPNSESWKYREDMESYNERIADYMDRIQQNAIEKAQRDAERQAFETRAASVRGQLASTYGMSNEEIADFWQTMDNPASLTTDNLVKLYRIIKGQPIAAPQMRNRTPLPPVPAVTGGGARQDARPIEDRIFDDIVRQSKRSTSF